MRYAVCGTFRGGGGRHQSLQLSPSYWRSGLTDDTLSCVMVNHSIIGHSARGRVRDQTKESTDGLANGAAMVSVVSQNEF
jgi:hypothetical protein